MKAKVRVQDYGWWFISLILNVVFPIEGACIYPRLRKLDFSSRDYVTFRLAFFENLDHKPNTTTHRIGGGEKIKIFVFYFLFFISR